MSSHDRQDSSDCPHCVIMDVVDWFVDRDYEPEEMAYMVASALGEIIGNFEGEETRKRLLQETTHIVYLEMCQKTTMANLESFSEQRQIQMARLN